MVKKLLISIIAFAANFAALAQHINIRPIVDLPNRDSIFSIVSHEKGYWIASKSGLYFYENNSFVNFSEKDKNFKDKLITKIYVDKAGNSWFGTRSHGVLAILKDGKKIHFPLDSYQDKAFPIRVITEDARGHKWIGTDGGGAWQVDNDNFEFFYNTQSCNITGNVITSIVLDSAQMTIFATDKGLNSTKNGYKWEQKDVKDNIAGFTYDENFNLWHLSKKGKIMTLFYNKKAVKLDNPAINLNDFSQIIVDKDVWLVTGQLIRIRDGKSEVLTTKEKNLNGLNVSTLTKLSNGSFIIGTSQGKILSLTFDEKKDEELKESVKEIPKKDTVAVAVIKEIPKKDTVAVAVIKEIPKKDTVAVAVNKETVSFDGIELKKGAMIKLDKILFVPQGYDLSDTAEVFKLLKFLKAYPKIIIEIAGHTDKDPPKTHPQYRQIMVKQLDLSKKRVQAVAIYLTDRGIERKRIITTWYGGSKPITSKENQSHMNRRVEMKILELE